MLMLVGTIYAADLEYYCPTVQAIYGVCSPELVANYIAHINDTYKRPGNLNNISVTVAIPPGTGPSQPRPINIIATLPTLGDGTPGAQKPLICYCAIDDTKRCVISQGVIENEGYNEKCEVRRRLILGLPPMAPWYANKIYMVS